MAKCEKINDKVLSEPSQYLDLLLLSKITEADRIRLEPNMSNGKKVGIGHVGFVHVNTDSGVFQCRQSQTNQTYYSFQVFMKTFMEDPIFRFESSGTRHTNPKNYVDTLLEKSVKTPHFHKFNENGLSVAYRTEYIEENEEEILSDINKGLGEFCIECKLETISGERLLILRQLNLFDKLPPSDPHNNITFD